MKRIIFFSLIIFSFFCSNAQEPKGIKTETSVNFKIKNFGVNVDGHFETISISTLFNSENELTDILATVEVESITTGMESRDNHILKEDFFYVKKHKNIVLETINIKKESLENYLVTANLTIKNRSKQITILIQVKKTGEGFVLTSNFEINRIDYSVGGSSLVLGKTVKISVKHIMF
ncbi:MAG: YceI family protein [Ignavibacteriae bacterium]|nr:YceI family protein [Ignavibacteriota bacterium]